MSSDSLRQLEIETYGFPRYLLERLVDVADELRTLVALKRLVLI